MKCDDVFDLLTGVSLTAEQRVSLEDHLTHCTSCCQLAEAFSPAVELLEQVLVDEQEARAHSDETPAWFTVSASDSALPPVRSLPSVAWLPGSMALACMLLVGVLVGIVMQYTSQPSSSPRWMASQSQQAEDFSSLALSPACWQQTSSQANEQPLTVAAAQQLHDLQCCTFCHVAGKPLRGSDGRLVPMTRLEASCLLCHVSLR